MRRTESAFTMIELLVAMVLLAVVIAVAGGLVTSMFSGSTTAKTLRKSSQQATNVLERFERDVRHAQSPHVITSQLSSDDLRALLLWGEGRDSSGSMVTTTPAQCDGGPAGTRSFCLFEEITVATPTELWLRSDVRSATTADTGTECVVWKVENNELWRTVYRSGPEPHCRAGSTGTQVERKRMLAAPPTAHLGNSEGRAASFAYLVRWNPTAASQPPGSTIDPTQCVTQTVGFTASPTGRQRTFITNITLDLAAFVTSRDSGSRNRYAISASLTGRATDDYARAAGCAF